MSDFVPGLYAKKPHEKAPDFVIAEVSLKATELCQFLSGNPDRLNNGYLNVQVLRKKDGSDYYAVINDWKPEKKGGGAPQNPAPTNDFDDDVPF